MLTINSLEDMRSEVSHKEEIREAVIGKNLVSFCYMLTAEETFDTPWARECRGIVFDSQTGKVVGRPLHKFFNVGEREDTQVKSIDWSSVVRVMNKRDGSLIHTVQTDQGVRLKSKKTFDSDVAKAAQAWMDERPMVQQMVDNMSAQNCTAIFEWTAPDARIVLFYPEAELCLLHVRNNETGEYMNAEVMRAYAAQFGVKCVEEVDEFFWTMESDGLPSSREFDAQKMLEAAETREGVEGWIVQFANGDMVKVKTKWYIRRHRAMTFLRERDIVELALDEGLDDLKSLLVSEGVDISEILEIESEVLRQINSVSSWVSDVIARDGHMPRKEFALQYQASHGECGWFGLLMASYSGKEPNFKDWYRRNALKEKWSLRHLALIPTIAEAE
jgi:RNA ligase